MVCTDRQLTPTQIADGFSNSRVGVARAIRPFSGQASPEALVDYINRELFPAVKAGREKLNEVYLQVADNAPSANPLSYYFSTSTVNADPTPGRTRLNQAVQNTATVIRVSELNAQLQSAVTWLDVMAGSSTTPIGVVTLNDRINPGRFLRFNLDTMTDQGTYWDLGVTPIESSHDNPFVEGQPVVVSFIASVASGGVVPGPPAITNRQIGIVSHVGGNAVSSVSRLAFSNANNVSFTLNTGANAATLVASVSVASTQGSIRISAGTTNTLASDFSFSNANRISFGYSGGSVITASKAHEIGQVSIQGIGAAAFVTGLFFTNIGNVSFSGTLAANAATVAANAADPQIGLVSLVGGNSVSSVTRLVFSNASNVTWDVSTGANAATIRASVAAGGGGADGGVFASAAGSSQTAGQVVWSNSNNVSFGMNGSTITASAQMLLSAGTTSSLASFFRFQNSNAIAFGMNGATITAIADSGISGISGGTLGLGAAATGLSFSNANNVSWTLSTNAGTPGAAFVLASATVASTQGSIRISAGTTSILSSGFTLSNSHNVSWTMNNGTLVASASFPADSILGLVSHVGGNSVTNVTRLAFSNASNVTWSLSTAAGGATVLAAVAAAGGGGVAIADPYGNTVTNNTVVFSVGTNSTISQLFSNAAESNNVQFGFNGSTMTAQAHFRASDNTAGVGNVITRIDFIDGGSAINFDFQTTGAAGARMGQVVARLSISNDPGSTAVTAFTANNVVFFTSNDALQARAFNPPMVFYRNYPPAASGSAIAQITNLESTLYLSPMNAGYPFPGPMTADTAEFLFAGSVSTGAYGFTMRGGVYTLNNSTRLSLLNSFSTTFSATTQATSVRLTQVGGVRYLQVLSSQWSSQPVFSEGVQYWFGQEWSVSGAAGAPAISGWGYFLDVRMDVGGIYQGTFGVNAASTNTGSRFMPFWGVVSTGGIPGSIGTANVLRAATSGALPWFHFRQGVVI